MCKILLVVDLTHARVVQGLILYREQQNSCAETLIKKKKAVAVTISGIFYNVVDMHLEDWWFVEVYFSYFDDRVLRFRSLLNLSKITGAKSSPSRKSPF